MGFGDFLGDVADVGRSLNPFDDDEPKKKPKRPKVPKSAKKKEPKKEPKKPEISHEYDVPIPKAALPAIRRAAARNIRLQAPPLPKARPSGLRGFLDDLTEGRGILGAATTGPIGLFARDDARKALLSGDFSKATEEAIKLGRYRPPAPPYKKGEKGKRQEAGLGGRGFMDWLGNVNKGVNVLPSMFADVGALGAKTVAADVSNRRGLLGLATIGPVGLLANEKARTALFNGDIEKSMKEMLPDWDAPDSEAGKVSKEILVGSIRDTKRAFTDPNYWYEDPVNAAFSAAIVLGPVSRSVGIAKTFSRLKAVEGATKANRFKVAVAENFQPGISGLPQGIKRTIPTGRPGEELQITAGRHPFGRALQRQYDLATKKIDPAGKLGGLSAPRRARRLEARRSELGQRRLQRDVNYANRKAALYINEGLISKGKGLIGDSIRRGRDSAIVMALQAPGHLDPMEGVQYAIQDTDNILERGTAYAPEGDLSDLTVVPPRQQAFYDGQKVEIIRTGTDAQGRPTAIGNVLDEAGEVTGEQVSGAAARFKLHNEATDERVRIPISDDQRARLEQRSNDLKEALQELESNPKQREKFENAVEEYTQLGSINEDLGHVISKATVGSDEWHNFLEGGRVRRNMMARRWRKQGLRAGEEDLIRPVTDHPHRIEFQRTITNRLGEAQARPILYLADSMAQSAAEHAAQTGRQFDAGDWWNRIRETTSGTYNSKAQVGDALYHGGEVSRGLLRTSLSKPEDLGRPLHGSVLKRAASGEWYSGITDNGDGTVRAWTQTQGWRDDLPSEVIKTPDAGFDDPLRIGERVDVMEGTYNAGSGKVSGYYEHPDRGPEMSVLMDDGTTRTVPRFAIRREETGFQEPIFYSKAQQTIADEKFPNKATAQQVTKALEKAGVKKEEIFWTGIEEFAELYGDKSIPKQDLLDHLENSLNGLNIDETVYSSVRGTDKWGTSGSYSEGGLIIREPTSEHPYYELVMAMPNKPGQAYTGGHFTVPNQLFHIRFHEIEDLDGIRAILIDELQSDPHSAGRRRGYAQNIPPDIKRQIDELDARKAQIMAAQNEIPDGHNIRYDVEDTRKQFVNEQIDRQDVQFMKDNEGRTDEERLAAAQAGAPYQLESRTNRFADGLRDTDWRAPEVVARLEEMAPGYAEKVKAMDRYTRLETLRNRFNNRINELESPYAGVVPDLPFKGEAWMGLAMKRLAAWGVDNGQTRVYWMRGHEHMVRYGKVDDLPTEGRRDLDPSNYDNEFYSSFASAEEELGTRNPTAGPDYTQEPFPEVGGPPAGERGFVDPDEIESDLSGEKYVHHDGRTAKILDWNEEKDGWDVEYLPAERDPWFVAVHYNGQGDWSNSYRVEVRNRRGENLLQVDLDDSASPYGFNNMWEEIGQAAKRDREYAVQAIERHKQAIKDATNDEGRANAEQHLGWAEERLAKMPENPEEITDILGDIERTRDMSDTIDRNMETELDQDRWDEFVEEQGGGEGDFETIRDWESNLDPGKSHLYMYDTMLHKVVEKTFKPFKTKTFTKDRAYIGRYSTEGEGVISSEGELPAHGFEITDEMAQSIRDSRQSLFQKPLDPNAVPHGALEFIKGTIANPEQVAIRLFDDADASTVIHELGHVGLYDLHPRDLKIIEDELQGGKSMVDWDRTDYERFARAFERHIMGEPLVNPKLIGPFQALAEIMQNIYKTITGYFDDVPVSPAVSEVFDRLISPRSVDEARAYFPHRSAFDIQQSDVLGGVRLPAGGGTLGIPKQDRRAFPNKANAEVLWETGEMHPSTAAMSTQVVRRGRYKETLDIRRKVFKEAHPIKADEGIPPGAYLVRDPEAPLEKIPERVTAARRLDEQSFRELTGDKDVDDWKEALKNIVMQPDELGSVGVDMKNVRWIEPWKVESMVKGVFPSAPQGKGAATLGMVNTVSRMSQIYLRPIRYLTGNVPANVVLVALTNPSALPKSMRYLGEAVRNSAKEFGKGPSDLARTHPALYNAIRAESGDVMAGAGLPEFYTQANNAFQKGERKLNRWSQEASDRLGEVADQPFRVAVWITNAKRYGLDTPAEWEKLLQTRKSTDAPLDPEMARIRDEIAQKTREDMIDFNAMTPWERQHISRFFYLWAFTRGFVKWPLTFARDYPERLAAVGLTAEQTEGQRDEKFPASWMDTRGQSMFERPDGTRLDFSSWNPVSGGVDMFNTVAGLSRGNVKGVTDYLSPTLSALGDAAFNPTRGEGWGNLAQEAMGAYVPAPAQAAISDISGALGHEIETPESRKAASRGKSGTWAKVDEYIEAANRFQQGKYSPSITKKRVGDWKDLTADYAVSTAHYSPEDVTKSYQAYWKYKEYEQRVKFGVVQREGRHGLNDKEKAIVMRKVAEEVWGDEAGGLASVEQINKASKDDLKEFVDAMDWMFKARSGVMSAATRRRNETAASRSAAGVQG